MRTTAVLTVENRRLRRRVEDLEALRREDQAREALTAGNVTLLDLGRVGDLADVSLNGRALGQLWKAPYRVDISSALQPGENHLEIKVTNQWTNRLAGDRTAPADKKILAPDTAPLAAAAEVVAPAVPPPRSPTPAAPTG